MTSLKPLLFTATTLWISFLSICSLYGQTPSQCVDVFCNVYLNSGNWTDSTYYLNNWGYAGTVLEYGGHGGNPSIMVAVIDDSCEVWDTYGEDSYSNIACYGQYNGAPHICPGSTNWMTRNEYFFIFETNNSDQMDSLTSMLTNKIPQDHWVLIYTYVPNGSFGVTSIYDNWSSQLYNHFTLVGSDSIAPNKPENGFIALYKQGDTASYQEIYGQPNNGSAYQLNLTRSIPSCSNLPLLAFNDTAFCDNQSVSITASTGFDNYDWNTGSTTQTIVLNEDTTYILTASLTSGCAVSDSINVSLLNCLSVYESENYISIFPNPAKDRVGIHNNNFNDQNISIKIYESSGKLVREQIERNSGSINLDVSSLKTGVYILSISDGFYQNTLRLVKE